MKLDTTKAVCRRLVDGPDLEWHEVTRIFFDERSPMGPALCNLCSQRGQCVLEHLDTVTTIPQAGMGANVRGRYRKAARRVPPERAVEHAADHARKSNERLIVQRSGFDEVSAGLVMQRAKDMVDRAPLVATSLRASV